MRKKLSAALTLFVSQSALAQQLTFFEQIRGAGIAIVPTLGLSILMLAVAFERLRHCRARTIVPPGLAASVIPLWQAGEFRQLEQRLADDDSTLARVLAYIVRYRSQGAAVVSAGAGDVAALELRRHLQRIYPLAVVATVAPILGLLGTVIGMIDSFHAIAFSGAMGDPALLAGGISKALVNTAAGLSVALPALLLHHYFKHLINKLSLELELQVNQFVHLAFMQEANATTPVRQVVSHAH